MPDKFLQRFRRITYSTAYLPQIDGLRFLAIFSVVVIMHISHYLDERVFNRQLLQDDYWKDFTFRGGAGVPLFFMISGFILSLPFAQWRMAKGKKIRLRNFYVRRLTRLEPPYFIALTILFIAQVWVLHKYSFIVLLPHLFASLVYLHTLVYQSFSWVMPVAWSLEVEVQFYVLAPLFFLLFLIRKAWIRRSIYLVIIVCSAVYWFDVWKASHVFMYLQYFFSGILAADLFVTKKNLIKNETVGLVLGIAALTGYFLIPSAHSLWEYLVRILCMFLILHTVLMNAYMRRLFSANVLVVVGGMCYSIYLLHFAVISLVGQVLERLGLQSASPTYFFPLALLLALCVLSVSAVYFLLVEKPFMKPIGMKREAVG